MKPGTTPLSLFVCLLFSCAAIGASADVIDPFTAPQGPLTVGPGEEITEEQAVVITSSVLGGLRVAVPAVGDESQPGSTATLAIAGGQLDCSLDFPALGNPDNNGGCVSGYDRSDGPVFDLTGSTRFLFDISSVQGGMVLGVTVVDTNENVSLGFVEGVVAGQAAIPFDELIPATFPGADLSLVDIIAFGLINEEGQEGRVVIDEFSTDGVITGGPVIPVDDEIFAEEVPGTYYNPSRDGEGCQLTLERDQANLILTCYFYDQGEQFWMIGVGQLVNGQIAIGEMTVTSGAQYGDAFDKDDVVRANWGSATMTWGDCNNADLELNPLLPGYEDVTLELTRIVPTTCGGGGVQGDSAPWMGAYFDPNRDGEGFHFGVEAGEVFVMTWYTYLNGKQVWMIGTGTRSNQQIAFGNVVITSGTGFGSQFNPSDVARETFGEIIVDFTDCNNFTATVNSQLPQFHDLVLNVTKIVPGACP